MQPASVTLNKENRITDEPIYNIASPAEEIPPVLVQENENYSDNDEEDYVNKDDNVNEDDDEDDYVNEEEHDEDDYVNEGLVIVRNSPPPIAVVGSQSQANIGNSISHSAHMLCSPKRVIDFGEGDFTFVDPKSLFPRRQDVTRSRSTTNMNAPQMPRTEQPQRQLQVSKSMGNLDFMADKCDVSESNEVIWALNRSNTPKFSHCLSSTNSTSEGDDFELPVQYYY